jgi:hypothetical protein
MRASARATAKVRPPGRGVNDRLGRESETRLEIGRVEAEHLGFFERIGPEAHAAILADDLAVGRLVQIFELEQLLGDDDVAFLEQNRRERLDIELADIAR